jgi:hypothetical protein
MLPLMGARKNWWDLPRLPEQLVAQRNLCAAVVAEVANSVSLHGGETFKPCKTMRGFMSPDLTVGEPGVHLWSRLFEM